MGDVFIVNLDQPDKKLSANIEDVICICGSKEFIKLFESKDYILKDNNIYFICKCKQCGLIFTNPRPTISSIANYYPTFYPSYRENEIPYTNHIIVFLTQKLLFVYRKVFENNSKFFQLSKGKILDIGCGNGQFLNYRKKEGWNTFGIDLSPAAIEKTQKLGIQALCTSLENAHFPNESFDFITLNHVLEHLYDPILCLKECNRILKYNGKILITVPNFDSVDLHLFKQYWDGLDCPRHLYHFTPKKLQELLEKTGFVIKEIDYYPLSTIFVNSIDIYFNKRFSFFVKNPIIVLFIFPFTLISKIFVETSIFAIYAVKS